MPEPPDKSTSGLRPEMAAYLKRRRLSKKMTQAQLAEQGAKQGIRFDESWVSQWERRGPKEGFIKALIYLDLVDADLPLISEMARARVEWPAEPHASLDDALKQCVQLVDGGRLAAALGCALVALRGAEDEDPDLLVRAHLTATIIARNADLLALAGHFVDCANEVRAAAAIDPVLAAKLAIESASVEIFRGNYKQAEEHLDRIGPDDLANDPFLRACALHARGALLQECDDARSAIDLFEKALAEYPIEHSDTVAPSLLVMIALNRAQLGEKDAARRLIDDAIGMVNRSTLPVIRLHVLKYAGRTHTLIGRHAAASDCLLEAETLAEELGKPLELFEVRLALLDLAERRKNASLAKLLKRRLWLDRQVLALPHRQARQFDRVVGLD